MSDSQTLSSGASSPELQEQDGLVDMRGPDGAALLEGCWAAVALADGGVYRTGDAPATGAGAAASARSPRALLEGLRDRVARAGGGPVVVRSPGTAQRPELTWRLEPGEDALRLRLEVRNTTPHPLPVERLDVLVAPRGLRGASAEELEVSQTGWQSWSAAFEPIPLDPWLHEASMPIAGPSLPPTEAQRTILPTMTRLRAPGGELLAGFVTARDQAGVLSLQPASSGHRLAASSYAEGIPLAPGDTLSSEELLLLFDRADALDAYAGELALKMDARPWPHVPTGWCSWYYYYSSVSERDMLENLDTLTERHARTPVEYVQLDDGYQTCIGDWLSLNEKFPSGLRHLTDRIRERGYKPGIWLAPFIVSEDSETYRQHPDWVLRDSRGLPLNALYNWNTTNYALDTTRPDVQAWLREVVRTMVEEWGFEYLKIDFVYAAALRAARHDRTSTGVQAYRLGVTTIREAAGDSFILGCGAPLAPSVGLVDGMRVGPDTATEWDPYGDPYGSAPALQHAIRSTLARGWMHDRLWTNDPDCLLVREKDSELTGPEVETWATVVALSGGLVMLGDRLGTLEEGRARIAERALPPLGRAAEPLGRGPHGLPERLRLRMESPGGPWLLGALFNWEEEARPLAFSPGDWGLDDSAPYHLYDAWSGEHQGPLRGAVRLDAVPPHGVRLLAARPHADRPQLVGSSLHLLAGAVEVVGESWEGDVLRLSLRRAGEIEGELAVYVPPRFEPLLDDLAELRTERRDDLLLVGLTVRDEADVTLRFKEREREG
jgi:alpha-galactosidase